MVHVRVSGRVKARAEKALAAMGLSISDAVRVLLTRVAAEQALPFDVKVPNAKTVELTSELPFLFSLVVPFERRRAFNLAHSGPP